MSFKLNALVGYTLSCEFVGLLRISGFVLLNTSACSCIKWKVAGTCLQVTLKRTNVPGMKAYRGPFITGYRPRRSYG